MAADDTSIHKRLPRLLVEIEDMRGPWHVTDPYRFAKARMQQAAYAALEGGIRAAAEIVEAGKLMRDAEPQGGDQT